MVRKPRFQMNGFGGILRGLKARGLRMRQKYKQVKKDAAVWVEESYICLRRMAYRCHEALAGRRYARPASFLSLSAVVGVGMIVVTLYTVSYAVVVDGEKVGAVADKSTVATAVSAVETLGTRTLGYEYTVDNDIDYRMTLTLRSDLSDRRDIESYFSAKIDETDDDDSRYYRILLEGEVLGTIESKAEFNVLLQDLRAGYVNENTISAEFVEEIRVEPVMLANQVISIDEMRELLTENTTGETT